MESLETKCKTIEENGEKAIWCKNEIRELSTNMEVKITNKVVHELGAKIEKFEEKSTMDLVELINQKINERLECIPENKDN